MQIRLQTALLSVGLATLGYWATPAQADEWNKRETFTFDHAVEVPGHVLSPGKYVFELADLPADRNVVQVFSEDKQGMDHLITMAFAVPDYRLNTPDKPIITFEERHLTSPEAVHSWFYPGDNYGWDFVYPKAQQLQTAAIAPPPPAPPVSTPQPTQTAAVPAPAPKPAEQPVTVAQNHAPAAPAQAAPAPAPTPAAAPKTLPQTASDLPLDGAAGGLLMALGCGVLASRRRVRA